MMADANGDSLWTKNYYLKNSNDFPSIIQTRDGGFALIATVQYPSSGGSFDYRILLMKTNSDGDSVWSKEFTGSVSYTHLRAHETVLDLVCRLLLEKKKALYYKNTH